MSNNRIRVEHFRYTYEYVPTIMTKSAFDSLLFIVLIAERKRESLRRYITEINIL